MLQIFNSDEVEIFNTNTRVFSILGLVSNTGTSNGSQFMPFSSYPLNVPQFVVMPLSGAFDFHPPTVAISGNSITWSFPAPGDSYNMPCRIICGVW